MEDFKQEFSAAYQRLCQLWAQQGEKMTQTLLARLLSQRMGATIVQSTISQLGSGELPPSIRYKRVLEEMKLMIREKEQGEESGLMPQREESPRKNVWEKQVEAILKDVLQLSPPSASSPCIRIVLPNPHAFPKLFKYWPAFEESRVPIEIIVLP